MAGRMSRRGFFGYSALGATAGLAGCAYWITRPPTALAAASGSVAPVTANISSRIRLHMFQTGWVAVKREHRTFDGPAALRLPAIMASRSWTEWMPVTAFALEHPEGLFVIDTGETARIAQPDYTACDAVTALFYTNNLQFSLTAADEIGPQMQRAGLAPDRVNKVIMTHLHSDHMGGMGWFPNAEFLVSGAARNGHSGALMCHIPPSINMQTSIYEDRVAGVFSRSAKVTEDGAISVVPTPGHANGHQSVLIEDEGRSVCIAGDVAFSLDQVMNAEIGGIVENYAEALTSSEQLRDQVTQFQTVLLPTHDPDISSIRNMGSSRRVAVQHRPATLQGPDGPLPPFSLAACRKAASPNRPFVFAAAFSVFQCRSCEAKRLTF